MNVTRFSSVLNIHNIIKYIDQSQQQPNIQKVNAFIPIKLVILLKQVDITSNSIYVTIVVTDPLPELLKRDNIDKSNENNENNELDYRINGISLQTFKLRHHIIKTKSYQNYQFDWQQRTYDAILPLQVRRVFDFYWIKVDSFSFEMEISTKDIVLKDKSVIELRPVLVQQDIEQPDFIKKKGTFDDNEIKSYWFPDPIVILKRKQVDTNEYYSPGLSVYFYKIDNIIANLVRLPLPLLVFQGLAAVMIWPDIREKLSDWFSYFFNLFMKIQDDNRSSTGSNEVSTHTSTNMTANTSTSSSSINEVLATIIVSQVTAYSNMITDTHNFLEILVFYGHIALLGLMQYLHSDTYFTIIFGIIVASLLCPVLCFLLLLWKYKSSDVKRLELKDNSVNDNANNGDRDYVSIYDKFCQDANSNCKISSYIENKERVKDYLLENKFILKVCNIYIIFLFLFLFISLSVTMAKIYCNHSVDHSL